MTEQDKIQDFDDSFDDSLPTMRGRDPIQDHDREREGDFNHPTIMKLERRMQRLLLRQNRDIDERLSQRLHEQTSEIKKHIADAFPDGDLHGHRLAHEQQIKRANMWDETKTDFIRKAFSGMLLAAIVFIGMLIWEYVKSEIKR